MHAKDIPILNHHSKFLVVTSSNITVRQYIQSYFTISGISNIIQIFEHKNSIYVETFFRNGSPKNSVKNLKNLNLKEINLYPDKLTDLLGFPLEIVIHEQSSFSKIIEKKFFSSRLHFIETVAVKLNATLKYKFLDVKNVTNFFHEISLMDAKQEFHLVLNNRVSSKYNSTKLMTYEQFAYCFAIPKDKIVLSFMSKLSLVNSFETNIWISLTVTWITTLIIWRFFKNRGAVDSHWHLMFKLLAHFLGQSVSMGINRRVLMILVQLWIFMMVVISSLYQSKNFLMLHKSPE